MAKCVYTLTQFPVSDALLPYLEPLDMVYLTMVCRALNEFYRCYLSKRADGMLSHFVEDSSSFRFMMCYTGAVVSGSFVLQFFSRYCWSGSDLDVFVSRRESEVWIQYLEDVEGYTPESVKRNERDDYSGEFKVCVSAI